MVFPVAIFSAEFPKEIPCTRNAHFTWLGSCVPVQLGSLAWEGMSWKLFFIHAGYYFIMLEAMGRIAACWR